MIEIVMVFALGFLLASLIGLLLLNALWNRAVRLTRRRIETSLPMSLTEIKAEKDHLRAEHAIALRKVEMQAEQALAAVNHHKLEIAARTETIRDRDATIAERDGALAALNDKHRALQQELATAHSTIATLQAEIVQFTALVADKDRELRNLDHDLALQKAENQSQRGALVEHQTRIDALLLQERELSAALATAKADLSAAKAEMDEATLALTTERQALLGHNERIAELSDALTKLGSDKAQLEQALATQTALAAAPASSADIAMLQEHLTNLAARMAHEVAEREGPDSAINAILDKTANHPAPPDGPDLAKRIRTLRTPKGQPASSARR